MFVSFSLLVYNYKDCGESSLIVFWLCVDKMKLSKTRVTCVNIDSHAPLTYHVK